jgi:outer membrane lipoprotein-sorting protein
MKKSIFLSIVMAMAAITFTSAQDLDKILDNHFKAIGQKKLAKIETIKATGKAEAMGMEMGFTMNQKRPGKIKIIVNVQGAEMIQAFDGETAWTLNPMMGSTTPVVLTGLEADGLKESADMDGQLWKYEDKGHQLELDGTGEVNGKETYILKLTKKNGRTDYYDLDKESYMILKVTTEAMVNGAPTEVEALFSDYREVDGYVMAYITEQRYGGQQALTLILENVETNVALEDAMFVKPE